MLFLILILLSYCVPNIMAVGAEHVKKRVHPLTACTREEYDVSLLTDFFCLKCLVYTSPKAVLLCRLTHSGLNDNGIECVAT